jgi:hypothetical protein
MAQGFSEQYEHEVPGLTKLLKVSGLRKAYKRYLFLLALAASGKPIKGLDMKRQVAANLLKVELKQLKKFFKRRKCEQDALYGENLARAYASEYVGEGGRTLHYKPLEEQPEVTFHPKAVKRTLYCLSIFPDGIASTYLALNNPSPWLPVRIGFRYAAKKLRPDGGTGAFISGKKGDFVSDWENIINHWDRNDVKFLWDIPQPRTWFCNFADVAIKVNPMKIGRRFEPGRRPRQISEQFVIAALGCKTWTHDMYPCFNQSPFFYAGSPDTLEFNVKSLKEMGYNTWLMTDYESYGEATLYDAWRQGIKVWAMMYDDEVGHDLIKDMHHLHFHKTPIVIMNGRMVALEPPVGHDIISGTDSHNVIGQFVTMLVVHETALELGLRQGDYFPIVNLDDVAVGFKDPKHAPKFSEVMARVAFKHGLLMNPSKNYTMPYPFLGQALWTPKPVRPLIRSLGKMLQKEDAGTNIGWRQAIGILARMEPLTPIQKWVVDKIIVNNPVEVIALSATEEDIANHLSKQEFTFTDNTLEYLNDRWLLHKNEISRVNQILRPFLKTIPYSINNSRWQELFPNDPGWAEMPLFNLKLRSKVVKFDKENSE